jgi:hypothetical protein
MAIAVSRSVRSAPVEQQARDNHAALFARFFGGHRPPVSASGSGSDSGSRSESSVAPSRAPSEDGYMPQFGDDSPFRAEGGDDDDDDEEEVAPAPAPAPPGPPAPQKKKRGRPAGTGSVVFRRYVMDTPKD